MITRRAVLTLPAAALTAGWRSGAGVSGAFVTSAARIVSAANAYVPPTTLGTAPSLTVGAAFGASMVPGVSNTADNPTVVFNDARLAITGPIRMVTPGTLAAGFVGAWCSASSGVLETGGDGWGVRFQTNSRYVELSSVFDNTGTAENVRLMINGQWAQTSDYTLFTSADFNPHYALFDLGTTAARTIEMFFGGNSVPVGFNFAVGSTLALPAATPNNPTAAYWGDSYVGGNTPGLLNVRDTMAQALGQIMGVVDIVPEGIGGQGYVTQVGGLTIGSRMVSDPQFITAPDIVYAHGSINDRAQNVTAVQNAITAGLVGLQAAFPTPWIVFFSGFTAVNAVVSTPNFVANYTGAILAADKRTLVIDTSSYPMVNTTGLLPNGQPHDSADGLHPGPNEVAYLTGLMKPATIAALQARAGLS